MADQVDAQEQAQARSSPYDAQAYWQNEGLRKFGRGETLSDLERSRASGMAAGLHRDIFQEFAPVITSEQYVSREDYDERVNDDAVNVAVFNEIDRTLHIREISDRHRRTLEHQAQSVHNEEVRHQPVALPVDARFGYSIAHYVQPGEEAFNLVKAADEFCKRSPIRQVTMETLDQLPEQFREAARRYMLHEEGENNNDIAAGAQLLQDAEQTWTHEHSDQPLQGDEARGFLPFWMVMRTPDFPNERLIELYRTTADYAHTSSGPIANQEALQRLQEMFPQDNAVGGYQALAEAIAKRAYQLHRRAPASLQASGDLSIKYYLNLTEAAAAEVMTEQLMEIGMARGYDRSRVVEDKGLGLNRKKQIYETMQQLPEQDQQLVHSWWQIVQQRDNSFMSHADAERLKEAEAALKRRLTERGLLAENEQARPISSLYRSKMDMAQQLIAKNASAGSSQ